MGKMGMGAHLRVRPGTAPSALQLLPFLSPLLAALVARVIPHSPHSQMQSRSSLLQEARRGGVRGQGLQVAGRERSGEEAGRKDGGGIGKERRSWGEPGGTRGLLQKKLLLSLADPRCPLGLPVSGAEKGLSPSHCLHPGSGAPWGRRYSPKWRWQSSPPPAALPTPPASAAWTGLVSCLLSSREDRDWLCSQGHLTAGPRPGSRALLHRASQAPSPSTPAAMPALLMGSGPTAYSAPQGRSDSSEARGASVLKLSCVTGAGKPAVLVAMVTAWWPSWGWGCSGASGSRCVSKTPPASASAFLWSSHLPLLHRSGKREEVPLPALEDTGSCTAVAGC